ncbi:beta/gamma crystallin-related protein [Mesorhizobium sp. WSM4906]|uniref:beta/gamma crystallin-related protein n=1 Tax=Mesorhizobium sp. WSM4906 TaxID=3038546 RepID=UPI002417F5C6|nr:beta/gamma crystallin-related protein [Mesorhizobium sp. WSM4906]WFP73549.1 beta/gamma crystallin-related protein [Mesorhizobium sp. WSM4906]
MKRLLIPTVFASLLCTGSASAQFYGEAACVLFENANFRGRSLEMGPDDATSFGGGFWNDRVSSVLVRPGCTLVAYEHSGMRGRSIELDRRVRNFGGSGWNDRISSAECYCDRY